MHVGIAEWKIYWKLSKGIIWLIQSHTTARIEVVKRREAREGGERERESFDHIHSDESNII